MVVTPDCIWRGRLETGSTGDAGTAALLVVFGGELEEAPEVAKEAVEFFGAVGADEAGFA